MLVCERGTHRFAEVLGSGEEPRKQVAQVRVEVLPMLDEGRQRLPAVGLGRAAYQLSRRSAVKDLRTGVVHPQPRAVFDGDIDGFIAAYLQKRAGGA